MEEQFKKDMKEIVWESRIQTVALVFSLAFFVFGIASIHDLIKKS